MDHTELLNELADKLEQQGCEVHIEHQNGFRVESPRSRVVISGTPDIIAVHPDGRAVIYDVKTGQPSASHTAQVQLYMYLVPRVPGSRWQGRAFDGEVVYRDGDRVKIPASSVNAEFVQKVTAFVKKMLLHCRHARFRVSVSADGATSARPTVPSELNRKNRPRDSLAGHRAPHLRARRHTPKLHLAPSIRTTDLPRPSESSMRGACQGPTRENAFSARRRPALRVYYGDERHCDT